MPHNLLYVEFSEQLQLSVVNGPLLVSSGLVAFSFGGAGTGEGLIQSGWAFFQRLALFHNFTPAQLFVACPLTNNFAESS